jgi:hydrogenase large subunit
MKKIILKPHGFDFGLKINPLVESKKIKEVLPENSFLRDFETLFKGRYVTDVTFIASRICSFCQASHQLAAARAVESAFEVEIHPASIIIRNLLGSIAFLTHHIFHFYQQTLPSWITLEKLSSAKTDDRKLVELKNKLALLIESSEALPFSVSLGADPEAIVDPDTVLQLVGHYFEALHVQSLLARMGAILGGRFPHYQTIVPGGVTFIPAADAVYDLKNLLDKVSHFIKEVYAADVLALSSGPWLEAGRRGDGVSLQNFLAVGDFFVEERDHLFKPGFIKEGHLDKISDFEISLVRIGRSQTNKKNVFYQNLAVETGALSRMLILKDENLLKTMESKGIRPGSVARHLARAFEAVLTVNRMYLWLDQLMELLALPGTKIYSSFKFKGKKTGIGLAEAPTGAVIHLLEVEGEKVQNYRILSGPDWILSNDSGTAIYSILKTALVGIEFDENSVSDKLRVVRVLNSFDLCPCSTIH